MSVELTRAGAAIVALLVVTSALVGAVGTAGAAAAMTGTSVAFCSATAVGHYSAIVDDIEARGASVTVVTRPDAATLRSVDVLWIDERDDNGAPGAGCTIGAAEEDAIRTFVAHGGALLVHGDVHYGGTTDVLGTYGIGTASGTGGVTTDVSPHPTTAGVDEVTVPTSGHLASVTGNAFAVVRNAAGVPAVAVAAPGRGRVVFMGDDYMHPLVIDNSDNQRLANNVFAWLAGAVRVWPDSPSPAMFEVTDADFDASTVRVGETVAVTVTVQNVGDRAGDYAGILTGDGERLGRQVVEIGAGRSATLTYEVAFEEAGGYQLWLRTDYLGRITVVENGNGTTHAPDAESLFNTSALDMSTGVVAATVTPENVSAEGRYEVVALVHNAEDSSTLFILGFTPSTSDLDTRFKLAVLEAGETREVRIAADLSGDAPAPLWTVNGVSAGNVTVVAG